MSTPTTTNRPQAQLQTATAAQACRQIDIRKPGDAKCVAESRHWLTRARRVYRRARILARHSRMPSTLGHLHPLPQTAAQMALVALEETMLSAAPRPTASRQHSLPPPATHSPAHPFQHSVVAIKAQVPASTPSRLHPQASTSRLAVQTHLLQRTRRPRPTAVRLHPRPRSADRYSATPRPRATLLVG